MKKDIKEKWVTRLRELDPNLQGKGRLKNENGKMCCLGVLCEIAVEEGVIPEPTLLTYKGSVILDYSYEGHNLVLPTAVQVWAGLLDQDPFVFNKPVSNWNDTESKSFKEIADLIETHL